MIKATLITFGLLLLLVSIGADPVTAEIYRWTDANGAVHFSDRQARDRVSETVDVRVNTYESVSYARPRLQASKKVVMYSASWCGICTKAKRYFEAHGIPYKEYDVERSEKGRADYQRLNASGVPVILVGKSRMDGFSERGFEELYD